MSPTLAVNILGLNLFVASPTSTICTDGEYVPIAAILVLVEKVEVEVERVVRIDEGSENVPTEVYVHSIDVHTDVDVDADVESVVPIGYTDETKTIDIDKIYSIILASTRQSIS